MVEQERGGEEMLKSLEMLGISFFLKMNKKNVYEFARKVALGLDKGLDARYGAKKSEAVQAGICCIIEKFCKVLVATLQSDWTPAMKKKYLGTVETVASEKPKAKGKLKGGKKDGKEKGKGKNK